MPSEIELDIASPCRGICKIDEPTQLCIGCCRSIDEITRWREMDDDQKLAVLSACLNRIPERQQVADESGNSRSSSPDEHNTATDVPGKDPHSHE